MAEVGSPRSAREVASRFAARNTVRDLSREVPDVRHLEMLCNALLARHFPQERRGQLGNRERACARKLIREYGSRRVGRVVARCWREWPDYVAAVRSREQATAPSTPSLAYLWGHVQTTDWYDRKRRAERRRRSRASRGGGGLVMPEDDG